MCYIYKNKYNKKINSLDTKNRIKLDYKKLRLADDNHCLSDEEQKEKQEEKQKEEQEKEQEEEQKKPITDVNKFNKWVNKQEAGMSNKLFKNYFKFQRPSVMLEYLYKADASQNNELVSLINIGLKDLKKEIKKMSEEERNVEKPDNIVKIVEKILNFNKQQQLGEGIKILTPNQMLSRLSILLAQLEAGNNSDKLINEIRQLLYSLYSSKNMTKQVYNNLIRHI